MDQLAPPCSVSCRAGQTASQQGQCETGDNAQTVGQSVHRRASHLQHLSSFLLFSIAVGTLTQKFQQRFGGGGWYSNW